MDTGKTSGISGKEDQNPAIFASQKVEDNETKPVQNNNANSTSSSGIDKSSESEDLKSIISPVILVDYGALPPEPPIGKLRGLLPCLPCNVKINCSKKLKS